MLEYEHLRDFVPARDEAAIRQVLKEHLYENPQAQEQAEAKLTPHQRTDAVQMINAGSPAMGAKLAVDDARYSAAMAAVSPEGRLHTMNTPVFLLAGAADDVVPSAETLWLARELPRHALQAMLVSPEISHVDLTGAKPGIMDEWRLAHFFALVMRASEKKEGNK